MSIDTTLLRQQLAPWASWTNEPNRPDGPPGGASEIAPLPAGALRANCDARALALIASADGPVFGKSGHQTANKRRTAPTLMTRIDLREIVGLACSAAGACWSISSRSLRASTIVSRGVV